MDIVFPAPGQLDDFFAAINENVQVTIPADTLRLLSNGDDDIGPGILWRLIHQLFFPPFIDLPFENKSLKKGYLYQKAVSSQRY